MSDEGTPHYTIDIRSAQVGIFRSKEAAVDAWRMNKTLQLFGRVTEYQPSAAGPVALPAPDPQPEIDVTVEELIDGRYIAYALFAGADQLEDVVTAKNDCRSLHKVFEEVAELYLDSGYLNVSITQKRRSL